MNCRINLLKQGMYCLAEQNLFTMDSAVPGVLHRKRRYLMFRRTLLLCDIIHCLHSSWLGNKVNSACTANEKQFYNYMQFVRFKVPRPVFLQILFFWDLTLCYWGLNALSN